MMGDTGPLWGCSGQAGEVAGEADAVVFDEQYAVDAFDAHDAFEGGIYVLNRLDEIARLGGGIGRAERGQEAGTGPVIGRIAMIAQARTGSSLSCKTTGLATGRSARTGRVEDS